MPTRATALALLAACNGDAAGTSWAVDLELSEASLSGMWGSAPDDVWAVGRDASGGRAWRYDGAAWAEVELPEATPPLTSAWGAGPDDVWMVGEQGGVLRWNGTEAREFETNTDQPLWGVWGSASDDIWMVGGEVGGLTPTVLNTDGVLVQSYLLGTQINPRQATALFAVGGVDGRVFAVGENGLIVEWTGEAWIYSATGADADQDFFALGAASRDDVVAVGGQDSPRVGRWDGAEWTISKPDDVDPLNAVFVNADGSAVVGGQAGYTATLTADGSFTPEAAATDLTVRALWGDSGGVRFAVGGTSDAPHRGVILRRN